MRLLRRLAALATALALTWFLAPAAVAGGPTSALLISPESGESAALYHSDSEYELLSDLLEPAAAGRTARPPSLDEAMGTRQITVTWMVHDVQPWRVDRVYPGAGGGSVWIHRSTAMESQRGTWHEAADPVNLTKLFHELGLMGPKTGGGGGSGAGYPAPWARSSPSPDPEPEPAAAGAGSADGRWWAVPAVLAGTALGLALRPLATRLSSLPPIRRRTPPGEREPRRQLIDR